VTRPTSSAPPPGRAAPSILRATDPAPHSWPKALGRAVTLDFDTLLLPDLPPCGAATHALIEAAFGLGVTVLADIDASAADAAACARRLNDSGLAGARLLGLDRIPGAALPAFLQTLRDLCPDKTLFGWTPGVAWPVLTDIAPGCLNLVAASLPWWDGRADWLWQELELLGRIAPVVADDGGVPNRQAFAAVLAEGWMTVETPDVRALNAVRRGVLRDLPWQRLVSPGGEPAYALLRTDTPDPRLAARAALAVAAVAPARLVASLPLSAVGGLFNGFVAPDGEPLLPHDVITLPAGGLSLFSATARPSPGVAPISRKDAAAASRRGPAIEAVTPWAEPGRTAARQVAGSIMTVTCDIAGGGHDKLTAALRWRSAKTEGWTELPMTLLGDDRWTASFPLLEPGLHRFTIEAWPDAFATLIDALGRSEAAGLPTGPHMQRGAQLIRAAAMHSRKKTLAALEHALDLLGEGDAAAARACLLAPEIRAAMTRADTRPDRVAIGPITVHAERVAAGFGSWRHLEPGDVSNDLQGAISSLASIQAMGFDVLHLALPGAAPDPAVMPAFQALRSAAAMHGMELALGFDPTPHDAAAAQNPWQAIAGAALAWARQGVRLFNVADPYVMTLPFWTWMTAAVQARCPDAVFTAGRGASPGTDLRAMRRLADAGFSQYAARLDWRAPKPEIERCLVALTQGRLADIIRPHFVVAAPAASQPPHAETRVALALAATLSGVWSLGADTPPDALLAEIAALNGIRRRNPAIQTHRGLTLLDCDTPHALLFEKATPDRSNVVLAAISLTPLQPLSLRFAAPFPHWPTPPAALRATDLAQGRDALWTEAEQAITLTAQRPYALWRLSPATA
jgi:starch synthase (maltosyl-transferring)